MGHKLGRWFGAAVVAGVTGVAGVTACANSSPGAGSGGSGSGQSQPPAGAAARVAELGMTGGFSANSQDSLRPPQLVVYSDGLVVLDGTKKTTIPKGQVTDLTAALAKDLAGQPAVLTLKHAVPDVGSAVLGVRQTDGSYQRVTAAGLRELGSQAGYPAGVLDAFGRLQALSQSAANAPTQPYVSDDVRLVYLCAIPTNAGKSWPAGLPQPTHSSTGADCTESSVVGGPAAAAAKTACTRFGASTAPPSAYTSDKGPRACEWRPALPDEK